MAFDGNGLSAADMAAVMRGGSGGGWGNDGGGYGGWWIILFFLVCMMGGWGNNGWGNNGNGGGAPYVAADVQRGFDQSATINAISNLSTQVGQGFADNAVAQCQGNANITAAVTNSQFGITNAVNNAKDTIANGMNQLAMSLQNCCCENRAVLAYLKYTVATEACADRAAVTAGLHDLTMQGNNNTNTIVQAINTGVQSIKDDLCADRLAAKDAQIQDLQTKLNMATLSGSQVGQTGDLKTYIAQMVQQAVESCCPKPKPAYVVANPNGCGCGGYYGGCGA